MPAETHSHHVPLEPNEIVRIVREQLAEVLAVDPDTVGLDARLREDLDADDYALIDMVEGVEAELGERTVGLSLDDDDLSEMKTVRDAVECVVARLGLSPDGLAREDMS